MLIKYCKKDLVRKQKKNPGQISIMSHSINKFTTLTRVITSFVTREMYICLFANCCYKRRNMIIRVVPGRQRRDQDEQQRVPCRADGTRKCL